MTEHGGQWQPLSVRSGRRSPDESPYEGVPPHLTDGILRWVDGLLDNPHRPERKRYLLARLRLSEVPRPAGPLDRRLPIISERYVLDRERERARAEEDLLDLVDATMHYVATEPDDPDEAPSDPEMWAEYVADLSELLRVGGSAWGVRPDLLGLERRISDAVATAARQVIHTAPEQASAHLGTAWAAVYGRHPNPNEAYGEAVKAVEAIARPLVLPNKKDGTLGDVLGHLRATNSKWQFELVTKAGDASIDPLIAVIGRLWEGHRARHSGGATTRDQTAAEAEAAVHLAVLLVQWLSMPVLRRPD